MKSQRGFTVVEILLALIVLILLGGVSYYVYDSRKDTRLPSSTSNQSTPADEKPKEEAKDPTVSWKTYSDPGNLFSFKHPATWVFATRLDLCNPGLVLFGANDAAKGVCASDGPGQMSISAQSGDQKANYELSTGNYPDITSSNVSLNGVAGVKQTGTFKPTDEQFGLGPQPGDKTLIYIFVKDGYTYVAQYNTPSSKPYPDVQADFEILVTKTLKFKQ